MLVGVLSIQIARLLGVSDGVAYLSGIMAVIGHRFPVFLGLRGGGQGMAASAGLVVYGIGVALAQGWLSLLVLAGLIAVAVVTFAWTRSDRAIAVTTLPLLVIALLLGRADWQFLAFMAAATAHIWVVQVAELRTGLSLRALWPLHGHSRD